MSHFDERAAGWDDDPKNVSRARAIARAIREEVDLGPAQRVLEYGAGTGLVSQMLAGDVGPLTLVDASAGMRDVLRAKIASGAFATTTQVWDLDLSDDEPPEEHFDLVVTAMTLHHIVDVAAVLKRFAQLLDDDGTVCIADLVAEDGSFHDSPDFHAHNGFDPQDMERWLREAGLGPMVMRHAVDIEREGRSFPVFLVTAPHLPT